MKMHPACTAIEEGRATHPHEVHLSGFSWGAVERCFGWFADRLCSRALRLPLCLPGPFAYLEPGTDSGKLVG